MVKVESVAGVKENRRSYHSFFTNVEWYDLTILSAPNCGNRVREWKLRIAIFRKVVGSQEACFGLLQF
jgi:hypothetical protein